MGNHYPFGVYPNQTFIFSKKNSATTKKRKDQPKWDIFEQKVTLETSEKDMRGNVMSNEFRFEITRLLYGKQFYCIAVSCKQDYRVHQDWGGVYE